MQTLNACIYTLLRKSERFFKTDMIYLAKGGAWLSMSQMVTTLTSVLLLIAFANLLPKEEFGVYRYILSLAALLAIATLGGMNTAILRGVARGSIGDFLYGTRIRLQWGVLGSSGALFIAGYYAIMGNAELALSLLIVAIFLPFLEALNSYLFYLNGATRFRMSALASSVTEVSAVGALCTALLFGAPVLVLLLIYFSVHTIFRAGFFFFTVYRYRPHGTVDTENMHFGKHLSVMAALSAVSKHIDKVAIWHLLGPVEVALYVFAHAPVQKLQVIFSRVVQTLALPKFSRSTAARLIATLPRKVAILLLLILLVTLVYILGAPYLFDTLFPQYADSVPYTQLLGVTLLALPFVLFTDALVSQKRQRELYIAKISSRFIHICLVLAGAYLFGIWGVVYAKLLNALYTSAMSVYFFYRMGNNGTSQNTESLQ